MRFLVALLALTFPAFAQIRYSPTGFTAPFISTVTNQASAQAYLGISGGGGGGTNTAALNGTNAFTGTNTFEAAKFFPANNIGLRVLAITNLAAVTFYNAATNSSAPVTNGGFSACTSVASITVPAMIGANSSLIVNAVAFKTNSTASSAELHAWVGTNYAARLLSFTSNATIQRFTAGGNLFGSTPTFKNFGSFTNQIRGAYNGNDAGVDAPLQILDSSSSFTLNLGLTTTSSATNIGFVRFEVYELVVQ